MPDRSLDRPAALRVRPVRLPPGADLRGALEVLASELPDQSGFLVAGIGSLVQARIRMADEAVERAVPGPLEIISVSGSISIDGVHAHIAVADAQGHVTAGHLCIGCEVRTTAELLVAEVPGFRLSRRPDPATGFNELVVEPIVPKDGA